MEAARRCLGSILDQGYPFIELLIIYDEKDAPLAGLAREFAGLRSHVPELCASSSAKSISEKFSS